MSFSSEVKKEICKHIENDSLKLKRKKCCGISLLYGMLINASTFENGRIILKTENEYVAEILKQLVMQYFKFECDIKIYKGKLILYKVQILGENAKRTLDFFGYKHDEVAVDINNNLLKCKNCRKNFIKGAFLSCGTMGSPEHTYYLELNMGHKNFSQQLDMLKSEGFEFKTLKRKKHNILYLKGSEKIEDFLYYLGSKVSSFEMMNTKIIKELRNNANRTNNFETANLSRTSTAVAYQLTLIEKLIDKGILETLDNNLKETALLRRDNIELSLEEIAKLSTKKISKSGINHRLRKIIAIAERLD